MSAITSSFLLLNLNHVGWKYLFIQVALSFWLFNHLKGDSAITWACNQEMQE